jgi:beta-glucanase (GH16 family)
MLWKIFAVTVAAVAGIAFVATPVGKPSPKSTPPTTIAGEFATTPSWSYDFSSPLDPKVFTPEVNGEGGGNNEKQYYTDTNAYTQNGKLVINAKREQYEGKQYTSARLTTENSFTPTYGRIVWKGVTLPAGAGTWPALWLWPANGKYSADSMTNAKNGTDDTLNGEIDVMEWVGSEPETIYGSAHSYVNYPDHDPHSASRPVADATATPHDYWLEWTPDRLTFGVDNAPYYRLAKDPHWGPANWPYDQPYFLVMNVAMGGSWGGDISPGFTSSAMKIDAVEYYPYNRQ